MGEGFADSFCLCSVSGEVVPIADIVASHIFQQRWANLVERRSGIEINDPANIILMHKKVEKKFDSFELTVMPSTYKVVILNKALLDRAHGCAFEVTNEHGQKQQIAWKSIDGNVMKTRTGKMPSNLMLAIHAKNAVRFAVRKGWCERGQVAIPQPPQADHQILEDFLVSQSTSSNSKKSGEDSRGSEEEIDEDEPSIPNS